jgi:hypothetical protein
MMKNNFTEALAFWKERFGCTPFIGQQVKLDLDAEYQSDYPYDMFVVGITRGRYSEGFEIDVSSSMDATEVYNGWPLSDFWPVGEECGKYGAKTPLAIFAERSLQVYTEEMTHDWSEGNNWSSLIGDKPMEVADAMLVEKLKRSDDSFFNRLDSFAARALSIVLTDPVVLANTSHEGFDSWGHMIAVYSYDLAPKLIASIDR